MNELLTYQQVKEFWSQEGLSGSDVPGNRATQLGGLMRERGWRVNG